MTQRRQFLQAGMAATVLGSSAFQRVWAQSGLPIERSRYFQTHPWQTLGHAFEKTDIDLA